MNLKFSRILSVPSQIFRHPSVARPFPEFHLWSDAAGPAPRLSPDVRIVKADIRGGKIYWGGSNEWCPGFRAAACRRPGARRRTLRSDAACENRDVTIT